jgi:hypothetical protein
MDQGLSSDGQSKFATTRGGRPRRQGRSSLLEVGLFTSAQHMSRGRPRTQLGEDSELTFEQHDKLVLLAFGSGGLVFVTGVNVFILS